MMKIPESVKTFGEAVRWAREQRRMTLRAFAAKMGVSAPFVSDVEHNRRHPLNIEGWAAELGVSVDDLRLRRFSDSLESWLKGNGADELRELLKRMRPAKRRCWCPICRNVIDER